MKNLIFAFILFFLLIFQNNLFSEKYATTDDGKRVKLNDDGTWEYVKTIDKSTNFIILTNYKIKTFPKDIYLGRFSDKVQLTLLLKNKSNKKIISWQATLIVKNAFGDLLFKSRLNNGKANIAPNKCEDTNFVWENNEFLDDEPYDYLSSYDKQVLKLKLTKFKILFEDQTIVDFSNDSK